MNTKPQDRASTGPMGPSFDDGDPIRELVVPIIGVDRYDRAVAVAAGLARHWHTPVRLVHVVTEAQDPMDSEQLEKKRRELSAQYPDVTFNAWLLEGDDATEMIVRAVRRSSLLVLASDHAHRWGSGDSVAETLMRDVARPVLLCGTEVDSEHVFGPVVVAIDGSPTAEAALDPALALATSFGTRLWLVRVVDDATAEHVAKLKASGTMASESAYVIGLADRLEAAGANVGWEIVHNDDPVDGLLEFAQHQGAGPIVVGSHGDSGVTRTTFGSTAMGLVERSRYPVLVINTGGRDEPQLL